jgi:quinol monooxygenase YgiN
MTTIKQGINPITLINIFSVSPANQQALVDLLAEATEQAMSHQPGFISANIHKSKDGRHVVNYAQWKSKEDFETMQQVDETKPHMKQAAELAEDFNPILCEVAFVHSK